MVQTQAEVSLQELYEIDEHLWLEKSIELIKNKQHNKLDFEHLLEELEELSRRDRDTIKSYIELIILHLLLLQYWQEEYDYNAHHWQIEIINFRSRLETRLTKTLRNYLEDNLDKIYQTAFKIATKKTKNKINFPPICPYSLEQILDDNFIF
jgi:hypothetical protein